MHAQPPGPGLPVHAPSVKIRIDELSIFVREVPLPNQSDQLNQQ